MSAAELEKIAKEIAVCTKCNLCKNRTHTVPGEGSPDARLLFIGEAPGFHEDQQGRPFVGQSGQLLNKLLNAIKLKREEVFIANVIKCRPPNNMDPTPEQIAACKPYLDRQIAAINPRLIVTLGRFSMARYWPGQRISQVHGQVKQENGRLHMPMFHPAAALRDTGRTLAMFKEDGLTIPALLEKAEEVARTELWGWASTQESEPELQPVLAEVAAPVGPKVSEPKIAESPAAPAYPANETAPAANNGTAASVTVAPAQNSAVNEPAPASLSPETPVVAAPEQAAPARSRKARPAPADTPDGLPASSEEAVTPAPPRSRKKRVPDQPEQLRMF